MILFREIMPVDDKAVAELVRSNLKAYEGAIKYNTREDNECGRHILQRCPIISAHFLYSASN